MGLIWKFIKFIGWLSLSLIILLLITIIALGWLTPPTTSFMLQHRGPVSYQWVDIENISPEMQLALIAAEDQRFPTHSGIDFEELKIVLEDSQNNKKLKPLRGASTLSQQVAKNLFLTPHRNYYRKASEAALTWLIELFWSKERILEMHLNIAEYGNGIYGVEAASWHYFKRPAAALTRQQSADLAAVLPNPKIYRPHAGQPWQVNRKRWILKQMRQLGGLSYLEQIK